jgi:creatinine amidohydrolase
LVETRRRSQLRFGDLTYEEIREAARSGSLAVVPTGCTEQQGPHLPVDFDTWSAEAITLAAAGRAEVEHGVNSLVLPVIPFGPASEHRNYGAGYVDVPIEVHDALIHAVLDSLAGQGFRRLVVWRGCGGHDLRGVVERFNRENYGGARAFLPEQPYGEIWRRIGDPGVPGGHADSFTTSVSMYLRPETVREDLIANPRNEPVKWEDPNLDFSRYSDTGVIGDPTHASPELGARLWDGVIEEAALALKKAADA